MLTAATGVGAGDLATGAFSGSKLGLAILWVVIAGALMKYVLTEGLARWQLVTGETYLEGVIKNGGRFIWYIFLSYLVIWTYFVAAAIMSAAGIAAQALIPFSDPKTGKIVYGLAQSILAVVLIRRGGFAVFERVMGCLIAVMFVAVIASAVAIVSDWTAVFRGLIPSIPDFEGSGMQWTLALMGGVGGTVTILCYGYWIAEENRSSFSDLRICRMDLTVAYVMTSIFGMCMVVLGSQIAVEGKGASLLVQLGQQLEDSLGSSTVRWVFLIGAWAAIFSSLLGVWQSVPYLFANGLRIARKSKLEPEDREKSKVDTQSFPYRSYLYGLAFVPALGMFVSFESAQKAYGIVGALFLPLLAMSLMWMNGSSRWLGAQNKNGWLTTVLLAATLLFFAAMMVLKVMSAIGS